MAERRLLDLFRVEHPIVLAPMAGAMDFELATAVAEAGGLGSLPFATLDAGQAREQITKFRARSDKPLNVNFFCHESPPHDEAREMRWRAALAPYYRELGIDPAAPIPTGARNPFDNAFCELVETAKPEVVSFHFGLPPDGLFRRVKALGCVTMSSATTVAEARWLEAHGVDVVIAQGFEAGGHRGMFLSDDLNAQVGTFALVPQIVDAVKLPVIAAGAVSDARGIAAALMLGAAGVQVGSAFLHCPESKITPHHRTALAGANDDGTRVTNLMTGRPARGFVNRVMRDLGPISELAPAFPLANGAIMPLRAKAEAQGSGAFTTMWAGQAASLGRALPAGEVTRKLAAEALVLLGRGSGRTS
ncbi:MAG: nitronate monooxygenase [Xanthobacteraceae bacterium]|nr:nitronate monooxygenase [Xanthobacteraceae bacterium]